MSKTLKEIAKLTTTEFLHEVKGMFPLIGILAVLCGTVIIIVAAFMVHVICGFISIPIAIFGGYWSFKFLSNVIYHNMRDL